MNRLPVLVLGGSGYVAGELLRLLADHPETGELAVASAGQAGTSVEAAFPHLAGRFTALRFLALEALDSWFEGRSEAALLSAAPHGAAAALIDRALTAAENAGTDVTVVDLSADFRFAEGETYRKVYGHPHGAPHRLAAFSCALPDLVPAVPTRHVAHPGCFTTAVSLAATPLADLGVVENSFWVAATTGSTGSGRTPSAGTHHPERHANLYAYKPLAHRHAPEMERLISAASGRLATVSFVPHSGPFARGIHATVMATLAEPASVNDVLASFAQRYAGSPFVRVTAEPPRLTDVVGTNRCHLGVTVSGRQVVVMSVIDNLVKGAAGGAVQWLNRLMRWNETAGLIQPGLGWL